MNRSAVRIRPSAPCRGVAQFGSALGSGPRGRWFKSSHLDQSGTSPLAKANKRGNSASLFCLPSAFRSSLRSKKLVPFEIVTALCVRLFRPRFARPYKSGHLDRSGTSPLAKANKRGKVRDKKKGVALVPNSRFLDCFKPTLEALVEIEGRVRTSKARTE